MNDPFAHDRLAQGALVFHPRPEARRVNLFMAAFFVALIALSWSPVFFSDRGKAFFLFFALFATACFGGFLGMVVATLQGTREPVVLDPDGATIDGRRIAWREIVEAEPRTRPEPSVALHRREGRPVVLRTAAYADGAEMGRVAVAQVVPPTVPLEATKTYRPQGLALSAFALGALLVMTAGLGLFALGLPKPPAARLHPATLQLGVLAPLLLWTALDTLTRFVRLGPRELTVGSALRRTTLPLDRIDSVEDGEGGLKVRAGERSATVRRGVRGFSEIHRRLLALAPQGVEAPPAPIQTEALFEPRPWAWAGPLLGGLSILSLGSINLVFGFQAMATRPGFGLFLMGMSPFVLLLGLVGLAAAIEARTAYRVDAEGFERRSPFRPRRVRWTDVQATWRIGKARKDLRIRTGDETLTLTSEFLQNGRGLIAALEARTAEARKRAIQTAEGETFGPDRGWIGMALSIGAGGLVFVGFSVPAFLAIGSKGPGDAAGNVVLGLLYAACGLGMLVLAVATLATRYTPDADGLEVVALRGRRFLPWREIVRAETSVQRGKESRTLLTLEHPSGAIHVNAATTRDFDRLRGYVLSRVGPAVAREPEA